MKRLVPWLSLMSPFWLAAGSHAADAITPHLLIHFDGSLSGTAYTLGAGEIDTTGTFVANGTPTLVAGKASLDGSVAVAPSADGFKINPASIGSLTAQNWVAEAIIAFDTFGTGQRTMIDVQGDTDFRIHNNGTSLQAVYWDGSTTGSVSTPLPVIGDFVHYALVWNAAETSLTAYVDGVSIGTVNNNAFSTPDAANVSFGYLGRNGLVGRGIDGLLDAVSFSTFTGAFDPSLDFSLFSPPNYLYWDVDGATPGAGGGGTPHGDWSNSFWSTSSDGDEDTVAWSSGADAVFAAGSDASGTYEVSLGGSPVAASVTVEEGNLTFLGESLTLEAGGFLKVEPAASLVIASDLIASDVQTSGALTLSGNSTISGPLTVSSGTLTLGSSLSVGGLMGNGSVAIPAGEVLASVQSEDSVFAGILSGEGGLVKQGSAKLQLAHLNSAILGPVTVEAGVLETAGSAGNGITSYLGQVSGDRTVTVQSGATLRYLQANVFGGSGKSTATIPASVVEGGTLETARFNIVGTLTLRDGGKLLNSSTETSPNYGGFQLLGDVRAEGSGAATAIQNGTSSRPVHLLGAAPTTFLVEDLTASDAADLTVSSPLADGSGDYPGIGSLTKTGEGTLVLTGANTFTGGTTVLGGILAVSGNSLADDADLTIDGGRVVPSGEETVARLYLGGVPQQAGTWGATGSGAEHIDDNYFSGTEGVIRVTVGPGISYAEWIALYPGVGSWTDFEDDPDGDGLKNGVEHVLGSDPSASSTGLYDVAIEGTTVSFRHRQTNELAGDVSKVYEWSSDLSTWHGSGESDGNGTTVVFSPSLVEDAESPALDTVEVSGLVSGTPAAKLFFRLAAVR